MPVSKKRKKDGKPVQRQATAEHAESASAHPDAAARFRIQAIPTLAAFRDGREGERVSGALPLDELRRFAAAAAR